MATRVTARNASVYIENLSAASTSISADLNSTTLGQPKDAPDVTGFGERTRQRLDDGLLDWEFSMDGFVAVGASEIDEVLYELYTGSVGTLLQFGPNGSATGQVRYSGCGVLTNYEMSHGIEGAATFTATIAAQAGSLTRGTWA